MSSYDIRFRPSGSVRESDYCTKCVNASATSVHLRRQYGLKPLVKYDFEVRARNSGHEGNWSTVSKYIGMHGNSPIHVYSLLIDLMTLYTIFARSDATAIVIAQFCAASIRERRLLNSVLSVKSYVIVRALS